MHSENKKGIGTRDWCRQIHTRLLSNDPTAPAELVEGVLNSLIGRLSKKFPDLYRSDLLYDAVTDALMEYIKTPSKFDPSKRGLFGYLLMAAKGDLLNTLDKMQRRGEKEIIVENVEVQELSRNNGLDLPAVEDRIDIRTVRQELEKLFDKPEDRGIAHLILQGERSTDAYADILGIESLPLDEQRRLVKRHKDRIKKRIIMV